MANEMNRKNIFKEIGKLTPSLSKFNKNEINFSSIFIVPIAHQFHQTEDVKKLFTDIQNQWEIKNNSVIDDLVLKDIKEYIKKDLFEYVDLDQEKTLKDFIFDKKNLYLRYKTKNIKLSFDAIFIVIKEIDLWIMDSNIAFFAYKIELEKEHLINIDMISTKLNRCLRDFRSLYIDIQKREIYYSTNKQDASSWIEYLISLTKNGEDISFLNIADEKNISEDLLSINNSVYYAKMITSLHINYDTVTLNGKQQKIAPLSDKLFESVTVDFGLLEELAFLLATTSSFDFDKEPGFIGNESYVYELIKANGINIWKFWAGIALQDALAFFSIKDGGTKIVFDSKKSLYFIYIVNLYVNTRLKFLEHYLLDRNFLNIEKVLPSVREIQILKNYYITSEISVKFQSNIISNKIKNGFQNEKLLDEVENNLQVTLDLTKDNTDIVFSLAAGVATLGSMWLTSDFLLRLYNEYPILSTSAVFVFSVLIIVGISKRSLVIKFIKKIFKVMKRFIGL